MSSESDIVRGDDEKTEVLKNIINYIKDDIGLVDDSFSEEHMNESSSLVIHAQYELLKTILPFCDVTDVADKDLKWYHFVFAYYDYDKKAYENLSNVNEESVDAIVTDSVSGFNIMEDELPFGNFESEYGLSGNSAGIAHLTSSLYNKGMLHGYVLEGEEIDNILELSDEDICFEAARGLLNKIYINYVYTSFEIVDATQDIDVDTQEAYFIVKNKYDYWSITYYPGKGATGFQDKTGMLAEVYGEYEKDIEWDE